MKKLLLRFALKPINRLQQTNPKIYWLIASMIVGVNTMLLDPDFTVALQAVTGTTDWMPTAIKYTSLVAGMLMGAAKLDGDTEMDKTVELNKNGKKPPKTTL